MQRLLRFFLGLGVLLIVFTFMKWRQTENYLDLAAVMETFEGFQKYTMLASEAMTKKTLGLMGLAVDVVACLVTFLVYRAQKKRIETHAEITDLV